MDVLGWLVVAVILVVVGVVAAKMLERKSTTEQSEGEGGSLQGFPYQKREQLLTPAERSFYGVLRSLAATSGWEVFAKVRLEDVIDVRKGTEKYQAYRNRIKSRHIDFLVCDRQTISAIVAIELNDSSHARNDRQQRDVFVSGALAAAGLPLLVVSAQEAYATSHLSEMIREKLGGDRAANKAVAELTLSREMAQPNPGVGACPKCGSALVERQSSKTGERFMGCSKYPACRHIQPIKS